ncbi:hypothetical protein L195_g040534 [Trifolium pratense]|uniref:Uncharacterized protein n=1 Tax=Trifolium pratense TaxID=57577 RepID=A0A2K3M140_TRIPR|nr:hypothetical protein L195_g040534 [Trifolium pratense]
MSFRYPVVDKIRKKLSCWKRRGSEEAHKIHRDKMCLDRENSGFGVRRVLGVKYGEEDKFILEGAIRPQCGGRIWVELGKGEECSLGGRSFKKRFSRLVALSEHKEVTVREMRRQGLDVGGGVDGGGEGVFLLEEELVEECCLLLLNVVLHVNVVEKWR